MKLGIVVPCKANKYKGHEQEWCGQSNVPNLTEGGLGLGSLLVNGRRLCRETSEASAAVFEETKYGVPHDTVGDLQDRSDSITMPAYLPKKTCRVFQGEPLPSHQMPEAIECIPGLETSLRGPLGAT